MKGKYKIYKSILAIGAGVTLAHTISYNLCVNGLNIKPFAKNEYELYRTDVTCYSKDGVVTTSDYKNKNQEDCLVVKKKNTNFFDNPYVISADKFSADQLEFLIQNIDNVELLTNEDYIKDVVREDVVENFDKYSFEYIHFNVDKSDVKHYESDEFDAFATTYYLVLTSIMFVSEVIIYKSIENSLKPAKIKILTKNDKKI